MYRTAVVVVFFSALAVVALDLILRLVFRPQPSATDAPARSGLFGWIRIAVNAVGVGTLALAAYTSLSALTDGDTLTGNRLMWHVGTAPAFAIAAVAIALFWADRNRFSSGDWSRIASAGMWAIPLRKFFFWIAILLAIPTFLSILAAMLPLFGTDDQANLIRVHRYCAPLLGAAGMLFAYFALVTWRMRGND